jgi:hypothetical protein
LDKAGGYALQEFGETIIAAVSGSESNVIGLPLELLSRELGAFCGIAVPGKIPVEALTAFSASRHARQVAGTLYR